MNDLTERRNTMLEAKLNDKLKDWSLTDAALLLSGLIAKCYQMSNLNFKTEYPLEEMALDVFENASKDHPNATMAQVVDAIQRGTKGEYGPYVGLSTITLLGFVTKYLEPKITINKQQEEEEQPKLLELDERYEMVKHVVFMYECVLEDRTIYAANWSKVFSFLKNTGTLVDYSQEREKIIEEAISKLIEKWQNARNGHNGAEVKRNIEEIKEQGGMHRDIQEMCKRDAVQKTLETWKIGLLDKDVLFDELDRKSREVYD